MSLDDHLGRVTSDARAAFVSTLNILNSHKLSYALVGGWAVFAYGSRIPSIDTDVLLSTDVAQQFRRHLQDTGRTEQEGPGRHIEILAMDEPNALHGFDWELETVPEYTPRDILVGNLVERTMSVDGTSVVARIPSAPALAFMKLKAMHDRCFDYRAVTDPTHMARINPSDRPLIAREPAGHYMRKAGKDLADVAFLCTACTELEAALQVLPALRTHLEAALESVPRPVHDYAVAMASPVAVQWIREHVGPE